MPFLFSKILNSQNWTRRNLLKAAGLSGAGFFAAIIGTMLWEKSACDRLTKTTRSKIKLLTLNSNLHLSQFKIVTVNQLGAIMRSDTGQSSYFIEKLGDEIILEMVGVIGGCFIRGSDESGWETFNADGIPPDGMPQKRVNVPGFFMSKFTVTQAQYRIVMGRNPAKFRGQNRNLIGKKRPVIRVSWLDAVEFCTKLSQRTGRVYRLPSEAEWEYACRAGSQTLFHLGDGITTDLANYNGSKYPFRSIPLGVYRQGLTEVGSFLPNAFGLYDMHGNVWEWCFDNWKKGYRKAPTDGSAYVSTAQNSSRIVRGGSWDTPVEGCLSGNRSHNYFDNHLSDDIGFRVVAELV
jgi:eukaryotic-like serine/threonine-protein kinase